MHDDKIAMRAAYAMASLTGDITNIPLVTDPSCRLSLLHYIVDILLPALSQSSSPNPGQSPIGFLLQSALSISSSRKRRYDRTERQLALQLVCDVMRTGGEQAGLFMRGCVSALVGVAMGWETESREMVVLAVRAICLAVFCGSAGIKEEGDVGRIVLCVTRLQSIRGIRELSAEIELLFKHENGDIALAAFDTALCWFSDDSCDSVSIPDQMMARLFAKYAQNPIGHVHNLMILSRKGCKEAELCLIDHVLLDARSFPLSVQQPVMVEFDETNLSDPSIFDESLQAAGRFEPKLSDLPFVGDAGMLARLVGMLSDVADLGERLMDAIREARCNGDLLNVIRYLSVLIYSVGDSGSVEFVANFVTEYDETVMQSLNARVITTWLQTIHLFTSRHSFNYITTGALLSLLLPKLFLADHSHRQCALRCLSRIARNRARLKDLVLEYKELLLDSLSQQLSVPDLFPNGPLLLASMLHLLPADSSLVLLEPFVSILEELLERRAGGHQYLADCIKCLQQGIVLATDSPMIPISKPIASDKHCPMDGNRDGGDEKERQTFLNDTIVGKIFTAAVSLLSSDFELLRIRTCGLVERCCSYYSKRYRERDHFLTFIHKSWDLLSCRIMDEDCRVARVACNAISSFILYDPAFVKDRMDDKWLDRVMSCRFQDLIPALLVCVIKSDVELKLRHIENMFRYAGNDEGFRDALCQSKLFSDIAWYHYEYHKMTLGSPTLVPHC